MTIETEDVVALIERASPLLKCEHHCNRPNPRVNGERLVGFVIGEDDIGLGLSEPLFALDAVVKLARLPQSLSDRIAVLEDLLAEYGDRVRMARAEPAEKQWAIDEAMSNATGRASLIKEGSDAG